MAYLKRIGDGWQSLGREADGSVPYLCTYCRHSTRCERAPRQRFCLVFSWRT